MVEPRNFSHDEPVPRISAFYGIVIAMYYRDHEPPHFHAVYGEHQAQIVIATKARARQPLDTIAPLP